MLPAEPRRDCFLEVESALAPKLRATAFRRHERWGPASARSDVCSSRATVLSMKPVLPVMVVLAAVCACSRPTSTPSEPGPAVAATSSAVAATAIPNGAMAKAAVGAAAPDFTLTDLDGHVVTLSSFKGKTVVVEWFNPGCPFVRKAHTVGSLKDSPARALAQGVVWLAVNSAAPGKQGSGAEANRKVAAEFAMTYPILLDDNGNVGRAYGATNTPNMFVIDPGGTLVYRGAIDNSPDGEGQSPTDGALVNYVDVTLAALKAHQPVKVPETKAYGCGVKYAS
jgi:peroxiredoxin